MLKTTINHAFSAATRTGIALSAFTGSSGALLQADWVHVVSQPVSGTFTSSVLNAGSIAQWNSVTWNANLPAGTSILVELSTGNTAVPDSIWSDWSAVGTDGTINSPAGQYIRYRVTLTTQDPFSIPELFDITLNYI